MPRNVRNFWLTAEIDGRASTFAAGPRSKDGGFVLHIKQRDGGGIKDAAVIVGRVDSHGDVVLTIDAPPGKMIGEVRSRR